MSQESKRRHFFISHHHKDDEHVSKLTSMLQRSGYDVRNSSVRMKPENQRRMDQNKVSPKVIERILRMKISWAGKVVVLIGKDTHKRPWVNWEIDQAKEQGKRIVGVYLRGGTEADIPPSLEKYGDAIVKWNPDKIMSALDGNNIFENSSGGSRLATHSGGSYNC